MSAPPPPPRRPTSSTTNGALWTKVQSSLNDLRTNRDRTQGLATAAQQRNVPPQQEIARLEQQVQALMSQMEMIQEEADEVDAKWIPVQEQIETAQKEYAFHHAELLEARQSIQSFQAKCQPRIEQETAALQQAHQLLRQTLASNHAGDAALLQELTHQDLLDWKDQEAKLQELQDMCRPVDNVDSKATAPTNLLQDSLLPAWLEGGQSQAILQAKLEQLQQENREQEAIIQGYEQKLRAMGKDPVAILEAA